LGILSLAVAWLATFRILFILYCVEAGVFLMLTPWSPRWEQSLIQLPATSFTLLMLHPAVRGAISGFGLVHLIWGAHDLDLWLASRRVARSESSQAHSAEATPAGTPTVAAAAVEGQSAPPAEPEVLLPEEP
jgi:hypothetical protein